MVHTGCVGSATLNAPPQDLALTEMELLEQNQKRLASLTGRMTTILNGFDRRLVKLESSILPIHKSTQMLSRVSANVGQTKTELDTSLRHYGVVIDDEPLILRGPDMRDPWPYLEAIQRVIQGAGTRSAGQNEEQVTSKVHSLVELGASNLIRLVREYTAAESRAVDVGAFVSRQQPMPTLSNECLMSIKALIQFLSTLPQTNTASWVHEALTGYGEVRAVYLTTSVAPMSEHVAKVAASMQQPAARAPREVHVLYRRGQAGFQPWFDIMLQLMQAEQQNASSLFDGMSWQARRLDTTASIFSPLISSVSSLLPTLLPRLQHGLNAHRFVLLDFLAAASGVLGNDGQRWIATLQQKQGPSGELPAAISASYRNAQNLFSEFLRDVKVIPVQREHDALMVDVSDIARFGMRLLTHLVEYQDVLLILLQSVGARTWTEPIGPAAPPDILYAEYIRDFLASLTTSLERSVNSIPQPTVAAIFLLNNIYYIQKELTSLRTALPPSASTTADQVVTQAMRSARTSYLESWNSVVNTLVDNSGSSGLSRANTITKFSLGDRGGRDTLARFFEHLQEKEQVHKSKPLQCDSAFLASLRDDVIRLVCPLYVVYLAKQKADLKSRTLRPSQQEVEAAIAQIFL